MKRVLIFGAYANGNLGDAEQAASVARRLREYRSDLEIVSASHSVADRLYYPDPASIARNLTAILDHDYVNSFDALLIGGGGLLASKHRPMESAAWVEGVNIPIGIYGVGANPATVEICQALLEKAHIVSVRDAFSMDAVKPVREDVILLRDPILNDPTIDATERRQSLENSRMAVIPRKFVSKAETAYRSFNEAMLRRDFVVSFFPATDQLSGALDFFPEHDVLFTVEMESFKAAARNADLIFSDRYHGCILGMKRRVPTLPLLRSKIDPASKIYALYTDMGMADALYAAEADTLTRKQLFELMADVYDQNVVDALLADWRNDYNETSRLIFEALGL